MRLLQLALLAVSAVVAVAEEDETPKPTTFNGVTVPPLIELTPSNWAEEVNKTQFLMVKHYSPYCHHCIAFAPHFQTFYEYYYTMKPGASQNEKGTFEESYGVRFATVNCVAYNDLCQENGVGAFPMTVLFKEGKNIESTTGERTIEQLSEILETALEAEKPGSRPSSLNLPEVGDKVAPKAANTANEQAKKGTDASSELRADAPANKPQNPKAAANLDGVSVSLTAETFQQHVTMTQDPWFIKFYAPWCPHCQAMQSTWLQLAKTMRGKLNIGEVNCDKEKRLCKDVRAKAFPTMLFFKGGERVEYRGLRGLGDFVRYSEKALDLASGVPEVDAASFEELEKKEEVVFVYFYDHASTSEDFMALERIPLSLIGHAKLVKTKDPEMHKRFKITTWPRLMVSREGRPTYYTPFTPNEMRDVRGVLEWMKSVWLPLVPELTPTNARQIMDNKIVVLGVVNRKDDDHDASSIQGSLREMKSAANEWMDRQIQEFQLERKKLRDAKQMRIEEAEDRDDERALRSAKTIRINMDNSNRREVAFAWVDGKFWQRWLRTTYGIDIKDGERIIINDQSSRKYWDQTVTGNHILVSRTSIMETLDKIVYGPQVIKPKLSVSFVEKILFDISVAFNEHPYFSMLVVAAVGFGAVSWFRGRNRRRGGHFRLDDSMGIRELKDGLLGAGNGVNGNTKAD